MASLIVVVVLLSWAERTRRRRRRKGRKEAKQQKWCAVDLSHRFRWSLRAKEGGGGGGGGGEQVQQQSFSRHISWHRRRRRRQVLRWHHLSFLYVHVRLLCAHPQFFFFILSFYYGTSVVVVIINVPRTVVCCSPFFCVRACVRACFVMAKRRRRKERIGVYTDTPSWAFMCLCVLVYTLSHSLDGMGWGGGDGKRSVGCSVERLRWRPIRHHVTGCVSSSSFLPSLPVRVCPFIVCLFACVLLDHLHPSFRPSALTARRWRKWWGLL